MDDLDQGLQCIAALQAQGLGHAEYALHEAAADGTVTNTASYTYDEAGRLLTAANDAGSYSYT